MRRVRRAPGRALGKGLGGGCAGARRPVPGSEQALQPCSCQGKEKVLGGGSCSVPSAFPLKMERLTDGNQTVGFWFKAGCVEGEASRAGMLGGMSPWSPRSLAVCLDGLPEMFPGQLSGGEPPGSSFENTKGLLLPRDNKLVILE